MGSGASVKRSASSMKIEIKRLQDRELNTQEEQERQQNWTEVLTDAQISILKGEKYELAQQLRDTRDALRVQTEGWQREKKKTLGLMFSDLPLSLLAHADSSSLKTTGSDPSLSRRFSIVTLSKCDVAGFSMLTAQLQPRDVVNIVDQLHAIIDEAYGTTEDIFVMEHSSDGCTAASGLVDYANLEMLRGSTTGHGRSATPLSMADSSYGSDFDIEDDQFLLKEHAREQRKQALAQHIASGAPTPQHHASMLATASLKLMSYSTKVQVPGRRQLQLRVSLHSGPCLAGVVGLQTRARTACIPHYKLFGPTVSYTNSLCASGLALQIRVSKECRNLLVQSADGSIGTKGANTFRFERCPDYTGWSRGKPVESYWLVGKEGLAVKLPSLDNALSLSEYEDIVI